MTRREEIAFQIRARSVHVTTEQSYLMADAILSLPPEEPVTSELVEFLNEAARYFTKRDTNGEDMAYWANVYNAENCRKAASALTLQEAEIARLKHKIDKWELSDGMDGAVVDAIRQVLNVNKVPGAAFIDDHVGNAIVQRNQCEARAETAEQARDEALKALKVAQEHVCSNLCPSAWTTANGRPSHHPQCVSISSTLTRLVKGS